MDDTVCVDIEGYLDLRNTTGSCGDTIQTEHTHRLVIFCKFTFALQDMDLNRGLAVSSSREDLALLGRDGGVAVDDSGEYAAQGFQTQRQRSDVQQQQALDFTAEDTALNSRTDCDTFIRVQVLGGFHASCVLDSFLNSNDSGRTADQQDLVQISCGQACVRQCLFNRAHSRIDQVGGQFIEFRTGQGNIQVLRSAGLVNADERQGDLGAGDAGQVDLSLFSGIFQTLHRHLVAGQVNAVRGLEAGNQPVDNSLVEVVAAQVVVTSSCQNFLNAFTHLDDGYIEGTAAEVIYHDFLVAFLVSAISQSSCGRFVDDTLYIQACNMASVLGCLTLCVGEVCRAGDNCFGNRLAEVSFCVCFQFLQNHCGNFLGSVALAVNGNLVVAAHMTFNGSDGAVRVHDSLTFWNSADHSFAVFGEGNDRRSRSHTFMVCNNNRFTVFHNSDTGVGCTKVNTDNLSHN